MQGWSRKELAPSDRSAQEPEDAPLKVEPNPHGGVEGNQRPEEENGSQDDPATWQQ